MKKVRGQHYVWRSYLEAWALNAGKLYCLRENRIFTLGPEKVAKERDFYRLKTLTPKDIYFIEKLVIDQIPENFQRIYRVLLNLFAAIARLNEIVASSLSTSSRSKHELDTFVNNAEEMLHGRIEDKSKKYLDSLKDGDASFFENDEDSLVFLHYLCVQHFRTKGIKEKVIQRSQAIGTDEIMSRCWNVISHLLAYNLCINLCAERNHHQLILLENNTDTPFLTSDQPTVNIHSLSNGVTPERLAFYYPVSPERAILFLDEIDTIKIRSKDLTIEEVKHYNRLLINQSYEMIFSSSRSQLESML